MASFPFMVLLIHKKSHQEFLPFFHQTDILIRVDCQTPFVALLAFSFSKGKRTDEFFSYFDGFLIRSKIGYDRDKSQHSGKRSSLECEKDI